MDRLQAMRAVMAVAEEGSFTAAGRRLGVSTKRVSNDVAALESDLSTRFFNRTTRSVSLTEMGEAYLGRCRAIVEQSEELEDLVRERQGVLAGTIRVTAPTGFGSGPLAAALAPFLEAHPAVALDLRLSDRRVALVEEGFDLAVRIGQMRDSTLVARKLADMPLVVVASPAYLAAHGRPADPRALATHNCLIDENQSDAATWRFRRGGQDLAVRVSGAVRANAPAALARMAVAGLGIARCPRYAVAEALAGGRLEALFADQAAEPFTLYALYPPNRHLTARLRALIDHLAAVFGKV